VINMREGLDGTIDLGDVDPRIRSWIAHTDQAEPWRLRRASVSGGRFDERRGY
jgi:hypothetical protein